MFLLSATLCTTKTFAMRLHHGRRLGGEEGLTSEEHDRLWRDLKDSWWMGKEFNGIDKQLRSKALKSGYTKRDLDALEFTYSDLRYIKHIIYGPSLSEFETNFPLKYEREILRNRLSVAYSLEELDRAALDSREGRNAPQWLLRGHHKFNAKSNQILEQAFQNHIKGEDISDFKKKLSEILDENFSCKCKFHLLEEDRDVFTKRAELHAFQKYTVHPIDYKLFGNMGTIQLKNPRKQRTTCWDTDLSQDHPYHPNSCRRADYNREGEFTLLRVPRGNYKFDFQDIRASIAVGRYFGYIFDIKKTLNRENYENVIDDVRKFYHRIRADFPWKETDKYQEELAAERGW